MPVPQSDGYDTEMTLRLAEAGGSPRRNDPWLRRPVGTAASFCEATVAIRPVPERNMLSDTLSAAPLDHPHLPAAARLLARWPEAYWQFKRLIDSVYPYTSPAQARLGRFSLGSFSHSFEDDFGGIHATVDDPLGLAQALVHEMAHQKLRALGVSFEVANRIIVNPSTERFAGPMRKDRVQPMTVVFHDQYSFMHVTALDLAMLGKAANEEERLPLLMLLARNVPRMQAGYDLVDKHIRVDDAGQTFLEAFMAWSSKVLTKGQEILDMGGYGCLRP